MVITQVQAVEGFEDDYNRFVERKKQIEGEVKAEYERVLAERTERIDRLIELTSKTVEVEIPDEITENDETVDDIVENVTNTIYSL